MRGIGGIRLERRPGRQVRVPQRGTVLSVVAVVVLFAGYALLLGRGAAWLDGSTLQGLTPSQRASEIDTMRSYLIQVGAGVLAAGALLYTALNFQLAREGHVTDRYTKAIEQLGSDRLDVRLGAIYALERIMIDSARDHPTIVDVLAAFLREHAPVATSGPDPDSGQPEQHSPPTTDAQAAITVLGRRPTGRTERGPLNLANTNLSHTDLTGANLAEANLTSANLAEANLTSANLADANLAGANLTSGNLAGTNLAGAKLVGGDLARAHMPFANLAGADLAFTQLKGANLGAADLTLAALTGANLTNANLFAAHLSRADLSRADLTRAQLIAADLTDADLSAADMDEADVSRANLKGVTLTDQQRSVVNGLPPDDVDGLPPDKA
jgi:uncharacterized protein YjbI with pentapeptide repeats